MANSLLLARLKNKRVVFHGKFQYGECERLSLMTKVRGGTIATDLDARVTHLVLPDLASGAGMQKKAASLRKKGTAIEVMDAAAFRELLSPTQDELLSLLKDGKRGARALAGVAPPIATGKHGAAPGCPRLVGAQLDGVDLSGFDLGGVAFENCRFIGAKLDKTVIVEAIACDFSKATGDSPRFGKIDRSRFTKAQFKNAESCSHLQGSDFSDAKLDNSLFSESFWGSAVDKRPSDQGPRFERACLRGCRFHHVRAQGANFDAAELTNAAFQSCRLDGTSLRNARACDALFVACDLRKADLSNASLVGANLAEADLTGARLDGADVTDANLRGAKINASVLKELKGFSANSANLGVVGPSLVELDSVFKKAKQVVISFRVGRDSNDAGHELQITAYSNFAYLYLPDLSDKISPEPMGSVPFSQEILQAGRVFGHLPVRFETLSIKSTGAPTKGKALRDLVVQGIAEAFAQPAPSEEVAIVNRQKRQKQRQTAVAERERRQAQAAKAKAKATKQIARKIEKAVGKVSDVASFLKALELRIEKPKIDKAMKMLKASGFKLFNDVTDQHLSGVVKSQTDPDLVYACRVADDGQYSCCTQNLNVCGGLRGSICKHLLVLIIGLVQAGELDPTTIDAWLAKTHSVKPELDRDNMSEIFLKYKGAEAGEVDWRPTETIPEDYYAM
jgi:uncharacterized protein YjbI with pentapeptide repeats